MDYAIGSTKWPGLSKLIEEAGEVTQVCGKIIALDGGIDHWDGTNLKDRIEEEIADVMAACLFVQEMNNLDMEKIQERIEKKLALFHEWQKGQQ